MTAPWLNSEALPAQLDIMLRMQDAMNVMVFPDWELRNFAWHRAIYVEAAEYLEHLGTYKWWKKGTPDISQAQMELVDIWHFGLSLYIVKLGLSAGDPALVAEVAAQVNAAAAHVDATVLASVTHEMRHEQTDLLVAAAGAREFATTPFVKLLAFTGMDFDQLFRAYVGKNMLNRFRQANGYKQGTYVKTWAGEEDNVHLDRILHALDVEPAQLGAAVTAALEDTYARLAR